jgi:hypothetical protein
VRRRSLTRDVLTVAAIWALFTAAWWAGSVGLR